MQEKERGCLSLREAQPSQLNLKISTQRETREKTWRWNGRLREERETEERTVEGMRMMPLGGQEGRDRQREVGRYWQGVPFDDLFHVFCGQVADPESRCRLPRVNGRLLPRPIAHWMKQHRRRGNAGCAFRSTSFPHLPISCLLYLPATDAYWAATHAATEALLLVWGSELRNLNRV